ncbi:unnamed protein product, partial [Brachionus calyciflorus]
SCTDRLKDSLSGDLTLCDDNSDIPYLEKRKRAAQSASAKLKNVGIINQKTNPYLKEHLYKTFIMPALYYGMEEQVWIKEILKIDHETDFISNIIKTLNEIEYNSEIDITDKCKYFKYTKEEEIQTKMKNNQTLNRLHEIFKKSNGDSSLMLNLLRYDAV